MTIVHDLDETVVLHLEGALRERVGAELRDRVGMLLRHGQQSIVLNLAGVSDVDAAGLGELVQAYNMTAAANGVLRIVHPRRTIRDLLTRVGLFDLLNADLQRVSGDDASMASECAGCHVAAGAK